MRDGNGDGAQKYRHGWIPLSPHYKQAERSSPSDWAADAGNLRQLPNGEFEARDDRLGAMWAKQGFDGKPETVSPEEFDALGSDYTRVYRGLHGDQASAWADDFRSGDAYPGLGVHGNGTYTATDRDIASEFAALGDGPGVMINSALRPEARVTTPQELYAEWDRKAARDATPREIEYAMAGDVGKYATALGYDAVLIDGTTLGALDVSGSYYIVMNRTALVVEDPNKKAPAAAANVWDDYDTARDNR